MKLPFHAIDWSTIPEVSQPGVSGEAVSRAIHYPGLRIRLVNYSPGYMADHWCQKGHLVHCIEGEFTSELQSGERFILTKGSSYAVSDEMSSHRSSTMDGASLLIIDGDFLKADGKY